MTIILLLLLIGLATFLFVAALSPSTFKLERTALVAAGPEVIFPHINNLKRWNDWSPWAKKDPAMEQSYSGPADGIGSAQAWNGNKNVGSGRMEIVGSELNSHVTYRLEFLKPMQAQNFASISLKPEDGKTRVTWVMEGPVSFPGKIMHQLFDMDKLVGNDFEAGLANLKAIVETNRPS